MGLTLSLIRLFRILQLQAQWLTRVLNVGLTSLPFLCRLWIENIFNQNQRWLYSSVYYMYSELFTMCRPDQSCLLLVSRLLLVSGMQEGRSFSHGSKRSKRNWRGITLAKQDRSWYFSLLLIAINDQPPVRFLDKSPFSIWELVAMIHIMCSNNFEWHSICAWTVNMSLKVYSCHPNQNTTLSFWFSKSRPVVTTSLRIWGLSIACLNLIVVLLCICISPNNQIG